MKPNRNTTTLAGAGLQGIFWPEPEATPEQPEQSGNSEGAPSDATCLAVMRLLDELAEQHGITPTPQVEWSTRLYRKLGLAMAHRNLIRLSAWLSHEQALATLRHELAHIATYAPVRRGGRKEPPHGAVWKEWAVRLGAEPRATSRVPPHYAPERTDRRCTGLECPGCGLRIVRVRVLSGLYCRKCGPRKGMLAKRMHGPRDAVLAWASEAS